MKIRSIFVLLLLLCSGVYAQEIRYYKFSGREVRAKDSADYIRVIPAPDPGAQHQPVQEYYMNRQRKFIGMASSVGAEPVLEGQTLSFYEDGRRKSVVAYTKGKPAGTAYHYHRNGCMAKIVEYGGDGTARVVSVYDTTGTMTVAAGNGYASESDEITGIQEEGNYADGRKSGSWKGRSAQDNYTFEENYRDGKLTKGHSMTSAGIRYAYTQLTEMPAFPQGDKGLGDFLGRNIKYPPYARSQRITGTVILQLTVEEDGNLGDIGVSVSGHPLLDEEAVRVLRLSPEWKPGRERGLPLPFTIRMPITFKLSGF